MFDVFGVFRLLLDQLVHVFDVFDVFDVFRLFRDKISHVFDVFDVFTCLGFFVSKKYGMCLTCLACLRVWDFSLPNNEPCV